MIIWQPGMTIEHMEEQVIKKALSFFNNNKTQTAKSLGIAIRTLDNKLDKYDKNESDKILAIEDDSKKAQEEIRRARGIAPTIGESEYEKAE